MGGTNCEGTDCERTGDEEGRSTRSNEAEQDDDDDARKVRRITS